MNNINLTQSILDYMEEYGVVAFAPIQDDYAPSCFYDKEKDIAFKERDNSEMLFGL